jgi:hypothetical protein
MKVILDIQDNKAAFVIGLLQRLPFVKTKPLSPFQAKVLDDMKQASKKCIRSKREHYKPAMQKRFSMSFKVESIPKFESELKRLAKKYPSLKYEYLELVNSLKVNPVQVNLWVKTAIRSDCQSLPKEKENPEAAELLRAFRFLKRRYTCLLFLIKVKERICRIKNSKSY